MLFLCLYYIVNILAILSILKNNSLVKTIGLREYEFFSYPVLSLSDLGQCLRFSLGFKFPHLRSSPVPKVYGFIIVIVSCWPYSEKVTALQLFLCWGECQDL